MAEEERHPYIDVDSDDSFLDLPEPRYQPHGRPGKSGAELDQLMDPAYRREHGLGPLLKMPPPVDH